VKGKEETTRRKIFIVKNIFRDAKTTFLNFSLFSGKLEVNFSHLLKAEFQFADFIFKHWLSI